MESILTDFRSLSEQARPYPSYLLPKHGTALALFAAGFHGWNDVVHFARAEMRIDCVDVDGNKLWEMAELYPGGCAFHVEDAWEFAERAFKAERRWDVVSVDPFLGDAAERAWGDLFLWCGIAKRLVTLTVASDTHLNVPEGWTASYFPRSSRAAWMVLRHG